MKTGDHWIVIADHNAVWETTESNISFDPPGVPGRRFRPAPTARSYFLRINGQVGVCGRRGELVPAGREFGLQAGFGVDIRLLPLDAPRSKLVERDARAGDGADDMVAVAQHAEGAREENERARPCRCRAST